MPELPFKHPYSGDVLFERIADLLDGPARERTQEVFTMLIENQRGVEDYLANAGSGSSFPWGAIGDATVASAPWYGVYTDEGSAAAGTGPSMQFGIGSIGTPSGLTFMRDATDEIEGAVGLGVSDSGFELEMIAPHDAAQYDSGAYWHVQGSDVRAEFVLWGAQASATPTTRGQISVMATEDGANGQWQSLDAGFFLSVDGHAGANGDASVGIGNNVTGIGLYVNGDWLVSGLSEAHMSITESQAAPSVPASNGVKIYAQDNGAGKTKLMALFATGAAQQIAIQP